MVCSCKMSWQRGVPRGRGEGKLGYPQGFVIIVVLIWKSNCKAEEFVTLKKPISDSVKRIEKKEMFWL